MKFNILCEDEKEMSAIKEHLLNKTHAGIELDFFSKFSSVPLDGYRYAVVNKSRRDEAINRGFDAVITYEAGQPESQRFDDLDELMSGYADFFDLLHQINAGTITVQFKEFRFGGGRPNEDRHVFQMKQGEALAGELYFLDFKDVGFSLTGSDKPFYEQSSDIPGYYRRTEAYNLLAEAVSKASYRDDTEYVAKYGKDKEDILVPYVNDNISREEALTADCFASKSFFPLLGGGK